MATLTQQEVQERVFRNSLQTCDYINGYINASSIITVKCRKHNYEFQTSWENVRRDNRAHHICPLCQEEDKQIRYEEDRIELECAYCHKKILRAKSRIEKSKSGLYFCCREHKDLAQRIESGTDFDIMRPDHYGIMEGTINNYRDYAFRHYPHQCAVCGFNEEDILQVHHIDENRQNNELSNLIILCPNCHARITWGKYQLIDRKYLQKK